MKRTVENLLAIARAEIGYCEKETNNSLDSKTANAGHNNYQKYGRDLASDGYYNGNKNGYAWCDQYVDWCFWTLCDKNRAEAEKMTCQTGPLGAGVEFSAKYYRQQGRLDRNPKVGDQAFFGNYDHTGIVTAVNGNRVTVIEGNKNDQVSENPYTIGGWLSGEFGHPYYDESPVSNPDPIPEEVEEVYSKDLFVRDIQNVTGCSIDGEPGPMTLRSTPTISRTKNSNCKAVLPVQKRLKALGFYKGTLDGEAGRRFDEAVRAFQKFINNPNIDGEFTTGCNSWRKLLEKD